MKKRKKFPFPWNFLPFAKKRLSEERKEKCVKMCICVHIYVYVYNFLIYNLREF